MPATGAVILTIRQGPRLDQTFELDQDVIALGREAGNDLIIEDPQVSRRHARLTRQGSSYVIEDLGSTNGTFVNGSRVTVPVLLADGDLIGLADTVVIAVKTSPAPVQFPIDAAAPDGPPPTEPALKKPPAYAPPPAPAVSQPAGTVKAAAEEPAYPPPPPPPPPVDYLGEEVYLDAGSMPAADNRRMILIGCGCLVLLAIAALIGLAAWSFIDCGSFSSVFKFLFPPFQC